jgi:glycosyltransferase involved in cell wall biosynthesis
LEAAASAILPITVLVACKNEELNIGRCLGSVSRAKRVLVVDSGSVDRTVEIARSHSAEVVRFTYSGGYPKKRQWALDNLSIDTPWVLLLDADESVPEALWAEIEGAVSSSAAADAYFITKAFHFLGRRFLFDRDFQGLDMEVHERLVVDGRIGRLRTPLVHQDFKGLEAYLSRHNQYSSWEAAVRHHFLRTGHWGPDSIRPRLLGNAQERRRWLKRIAITIPLEPVLWFLYHYVLRLAILEGRRGLVASSIRAAYIDQVHAKMYELALSSDA